MGRPETIICTRCDASVAVKSKGPVPSFCADCRRSGRRTSTRPSVIACERCGADVPVRDRGPLPRSCRDGCPTPAKKSPKSNKKPRKSKTPPAIETETPAATVQRPWDRTPSRKATGKRTPAPAQTAPTLTERVSPDAIRIDTAYPAVGTADLSRAVRAGRVRRRVALLGWVAIVLIIALIVFLGSQPAPTDF